MLRPRSFAGFRLANRWTISALVIGLFLALPLLVVASHLLLPGGQAWDHLAATVLPRYIGTTLGLLALVVVGVALVGVTTAWLVAACDFPGRRWLEWALLLPLAMPAYVMAYAYTDLLQFSGPVQTWLRGAMGWNAGDYFFPDVRSVGGAAAMFICVLYPYVYLLARVAFLEQPASLSEAGRTMGLSPWSSFFRVSLPMARPAIAAGASLALMETLADYGTVAYFGVQTFTTGIFRAWMSMGEPVSAAKLSVILLVFVAVVLTIERMARRRARFGDVPSGARRVRVVLRGSRAWIATFACILPLILGFALPAALLARLSFGGGDAQFGARFVTLAANSALVATLTAFIAVALALFLAYGARISRSPAAAAVNRFSNLGYAVPGAVIAIGVLIPASRLDHAIADAVQRVFNVEIGLLFTGSLAALVYAYLIRFLAIALQTVEAGLSRVTPNMEDAARSLGMNAGETLAKVHAPMLRSSLVTAALLVFVDVMKELPATFVMRPFNFDTLAVQAYNLASDERLAEASTASLAIVAVGLVPLVVASRRLVRRGD
ncbi:ABC transporter permease [Usitatibacter palustris]|uniref:ABC transporter permease n=1 Tax=Usitatibacter palustris TaxID=2732487 RepID=UPI001FE666D1|nr:iron ABC transporter permease [Usitatibacter palustris]